VVEDGRDGFLVPPTNPEKLAARIIDLLSNPGLAATFGQRARDKVARQFSLERMVRQYEALYERCMNGN
jgi:glycosyltransferase involved in cell wall biosynthesis